MVAVFLLFAVVVLRSDDGRGNLKGFAVGVSD